MSLTPDEAANSLREADATEKRSKESYCYQIASPYFLIWGCIWVLGYGGNDLLHDVRAGWLWDGLTLAGVAASIGISIYNARMRGARGGWRVGAQFAIIIAYCAALELMLWPVMHGRLIGVIIPLLWAAIYASFGLWKGTRFMIVGAFLAAATLGGFFLLREHFPLWMAIAGGGSMILTGLWLRKA